MPTPTTLSAAFVVATLLPLLLGVVNQMIQSKMIFGQWPLPTKWLPFVTIFGGFLTGATSYVTTQSSFVLNSMTVFMMLIAGVYSLVLAQQAGNVVHHFGGAINSRRPAPLTPAQPASKDAGKTDPPEATKTDPNAVTEVPPPPAS